MTHALVVGGTGMLSGAVCELTARGHDVTVLARRPERLQRLATRAPGPGTVHGVALDYREADRLRAAVRDAGAVRGPLDTVVAWIHGTAPGAHELVAGEVGQSPPTCRYLEVLGSAGGDPATIAPERAEALAALPWLDHCRVVLGFVRDAGRSRWLTDDEISGGVIEALDGGKAEHVVGSVEPWSARP